MTNLTLTEAVLLHGGKLSDEPGYDFDALWTAAAKMTGDDITGKGSIEKAQIVGRAVPIFKNTFPKLAMQLDAELPKPVSAAKAQQWIYDNIGVLPESFEIPARGNQVSKTSD